MEQKSWGRKSKEFKVHSLIDKVYKKLNLYIAFEKVKANKGEGGVDRVSLEEFEKNLVLNIEEIHRLLKEDRYEPQPVQRVWIPKTNGDKRPLGIPTIRDRVVQQAILNRMERIFEPEFCENSYGFRKRRSCHQAIEKVEEYIKSGGQWIVKVDIQKFFDTLDHKKLMELINKEISDGRILRMIEAFLKSGVMEDIEFKEQTNGTPQGGVISPLLANIYLHEYDKIMSEEKYQVVRYADDIVVICKTRKEAERVQARTMEILEGELKLKVNPDKTKIVHKSQGFEFLGYKFGRGYTDYKIPRDRAVRTFKEKVRYITRRQQPKSMQEVIKDLTPIIRGWGNYFIKGNSQNIFWKLDLWITERISAYRVGKWGSYARKKYKYTMFRTMGLVYLNDILYPRQLELFPAKGQHLRRAECWKTARSVR